MKKTKRILAAALGAALSVTTLTATTPLMASAFAEGGKHTAKDATAILKDVVGIQKLTGADRAAADLDSDGYITAKDATYVLKIVAGLLPENPVTPPTNPDEPTEPTKPTDPVITVPEDTTCKHDFKISTIPAKCETEGSKTYTCKKCGYSYTETIAPLGHNYKTTTVNGLKMIPKTETWYLVNNYNAYTTKQTEVWNCDNLEIETYYPEYGPEPHNSIDVTKTDGPWIFTNRLYILNAQYWTNSPTLDWNGTGEMIYKPTESEVAHNADKYMESKGISNLLYGNWTDIPEFIKTETRPVPGEYGLIPENKTKTICTRCKHNPDETEHTHTYVLTNDVYNGKANYICECGDQFVKTVNTKYPPNNVTGPNDSKFTTHTHIYTRTDWESSEISHITEYPDAVYTCECGDSFKRNMSEIIANNEWIPDNCTIIGDKIVANN